MDFEDINRERIAQKRSVAELCRTAGVAYSTYWFIRKGRFKGHRSTFNKLRLALGLKPKGRVRPQVASGIIAATFRGYAAQFSTQLGEDPAIILAEDPAKRATSNDAWSRAAKIRGMAVYCTVIELDLRGSEVARAIGITKQAVSQICKRVEDERDDPEIDRMIEATGRLISGRAA